MSSTHWSDNLPKDACQEAVTWAKTQGSFKEAWENCQRGNWMLWLTSKIIGNTRDTPLGVNLWLVRADIAQLVLPIYEKQFPTDDRVRDCIQAIRDYASGKIDKAKLKEYKTAAANAATQINCANIIRSKLGVDPQTHLGLVAL